jgi:hypothetical protein
MREPSAVIPVTAVVDDDGLVHIEGDDLSLVCWNHRPALLQARHLLLAAFPMSTESSSHPGSNPDPNRHPRGSMCRHRVSCRLRSSR